METSNDRNVHHGTAVEKVHNWNEILRLIVAVRVDQMSDSITSAITVVDT